MLPHLPAMHAHSFIITAIGKRCLPLMLLCTAWAGNGEAPPLPAADAAPENEASDNAAIPQDRPAPLSSPSADVSYRLETRASRHGIGNFFTLIPPGPVSSIVVEWLTAQQQNWFPEASCQQQPTPLNEMEWLLGLSEKRILQEIDKHNQLFHEHLDWILYHGIAQDETGAGLKALALWQQDLQGNLQNIERRQDQLGEQQDSMQTLLSILIGSAILHFILLLYLLYRMQQKEQKPEPPTGPENGQPQQEDSAEPEAAHEATGQPTEQPAEQHAGQPSDHPAASPMHIVPCDPATQDVPPPGASAPLGALQAALASPPAEPWKDFCNQPLPKQLEAPYPGFWKESREETAESESLAPAADCGLAGGVLPRQYEEYRSRDVQETIARAFAAWAEKRPDGRSLLLEADADSRYWFVGDIHGGFRAFARILDFVRHDMMADGKAKRHTLILLGDYIDRGNEDFAVLAMVEELLMGSGAEGALPLSVIALRGNHDIGLVRKNGGLFDSSVKPAETAAALNAMIQDGAVDAAQSLGKAAMELARICPCMGELTHLSPLKPEATILFTHGGLPHTDLQQTAYGQLPAACIKGELTPALPDDFRKAWEEDFTWIRLVAKAPYKIPNRGSHGCDMGTADVNAYRRLHWRLTGRAITFIIRGHDHEKGGYRLYSYDQVENDTTRSGVQRNCGVLTINALDVMELEKSAESGVPYAGHAVVAGWSRGQAVSLYRLPVANDKEQLS